MKLINQNKDNLNYTYRKQLDRIQLWNRLDSKIALLMANQTTIDVYWIITNKLKLNVRTMVTLQCYLPIATSIDKVLSNETN